MRALRRVRDLLLSARWVLVGAMVLGAAGLAFIGSGSTPHRVTVRFADANGLVNGNEVRLAGVEVGSVDSIGVGTEQTTVRDVNGSHQATVSYAEAVLNINDAQWPLRQGTLFAVRPKGVLSNVYVSLTPGPAGAAALDAGKVIDLPQTQSPINLDELSNVFSKPVTDSIRTQIQQGVIALGGNGASDLNATLGNLVPLTNDLIPLTDVLAQRSPELDRLNIEFATISGELASEDSNLRGVIENSNRLFGVLAAKQTDLKNLLDNAASSLTDLDTVFAGEQNNLTAIFQRIPTALDKAKSTSDLLTPLITQVNPHIPNLNVLLHYFITGNGYLSTSGVYSLRVNATLPIQGRGSYSCGGAPDEQKHCPYTAQLTPNTSATNGSAGSSPTEASANTPDPFLGGLFG